MNNYLKSFLMLLEMEKKQEAVEYALELLQNGTIDVIELYSNVLSPALNNMACSIKDKQICIWKEHVRTAIVRTIVECCYPYVIRQRDKLFNVIKGTAVVLCPPEEYHDLGARMVADYFEICGYDVVFVGSNTPYEDFYNSVDIIKPNIIAISVSDYYNLVVTKKIINDLRKKTKGKVKIVVGGYAFIDNEKNISVVEADYYAHSFDDIKAISEKEVKI